LRLDVGHDYRVDDVVVPRSSIASSMRHKYFVGCCVARSRAPSSQSTVVVIASCDTTYQSTLVAVIHTINSAYCCHPCNQQHMYNLIVASSRLAMVGSLSSHAPWQYLQLLLATSKVVCRRFSRNTTLRVCSLSSLLAIRARLPSSFRMTAYNIFDCCVVGHPRHTLITVPRVLAMVVLLYRRSPPRDMI
jgi:hypothetical protein